MTIEHPVTVCGHVRETPLRGRAERLRPGKTGNMRKYISLDKTLCEDREYVLLASLPADPRARVGTLEACVKKALESQDDQAVRALASLLFRAIQDIWLLPHVDEKSGFLEDETDEGRLAFIESQRAIAEKALQLWPMLWTPEQRIRTEARQTSGEYIDPRDLMLEVRSYVLRAIMNWMRDTPSEEESDEIFTKLLDIHRGLSFIDEWKMVDNQSREVTNQRYEPKRLLRHYLMAACHDPDYARIFALGLVKRAPWHALYSALKTVEPIFGASSAAHEYARSVIEDAVLRAQEVEELVEKIELRPYFKGGVKVGFDSQQRLVLDVEVQEDPSHFPVPEDHIRQFKEYHAELCGYGTEWSLKQHREVLLYVKWGGLSYPSRI